jgi:hypothetical protein
MFPAFTYAELQQKFCEGFGYHPFTGLEQYGCFIYKSYAPYDNTAKILDRYCKEYDVNSMMAEQLTQKLQEENIPVGGELLYFVQCTGFKLEERFYTLKKRPAIYRRMLQTLENYHKVLAIFQHEVQQGMAIQLCSLSGLAVKAEDGSCSTLSEDNINRVQSMIQEFLSNTDVFVTFLSGCIEQKPAFRKLLLTKTEEAGLKDMFGLVTAFRRQQQETYYMLKYWKKQLFRLKTQCTLN